MSHEECEPEEADMVPEQHPPTVVAGADLSDGEGARSQGDMEARKEESEAERKMLRQPRSGHSANACGCDADGKPTLGDRIDLAHEFFPRCHDDVHEMDAAEQQQHYAADVGSDARARGAESDEDEPGGRRHQVEDRGRADRHEPRHEDRDGCRQALDGRGEQKRRRCRHHQLSQCRQSGLESDRTGWFGPLPGRRNKGGRFGPRRGSVVGRCTASGAGGPPSTGGPKVAGSMGADGSAGAEEPAGAEGPAGAQGPTGAEGPTGAGGAGGRLKI
eukprot:982049-Prymnesium_polylepis.1